MFHIVSFASIVVFALVALIFFYVGVFGGDDQGNTGTWTVAEINAKFIRDPEIRIYRVAVEFEDGEVTLSGTVNSEEARQNAGRLAGQVPTVKQVVNEIRVEPRSVVDDIVNATTDQSTDEPRVGAAASRPGTGSVIDQNQAAIDDTIRAEVRRVRAEKGDPTNKKVQISVANGVITVTGEVRSKLDILHARILAEDIPGVREVKLELEVVP